MLMMSASATMRLHALIALLVCAAVVTSVFLGDNRGQHHVPRDLLSMALVDNQTPVLPVPAGVGSPDGALNTGTTSQEEIDSKFWSIVAHRTVEVGSAARWAIRGRTPIGLIWDGEQLLSHKLKNLQDYLECPSGNCDGAPTPRPTVTTTPEGNQACLAYPPSEQPDPTHYLDADCFNLSGGSLSSASSTYGYRIWPSGLNPQTGLKFAPGSVSQSLRLSVGWVRIDYGC